MVAQHPGQFHHNRRRQREPNATKSRSGVEVGSQLAFFRDANNGSKASPVLQVTGCPADRHRHHPFRKRAPLHLPSLGHLRERGSTWTPTRSSALINAPAAAVIGSLVARLHVASDPSKLDADSKAPRGRGGQSRCGFNAFVPFRFSLFCGGCAENVRSTRRGDAPRC